MYVFLCMCAQKWIAMILSLHMCVVLLHFLKKEKKMEGGKPNFPHLSHFLNQTSRFHIIYQL